jgi:hypothetical protein
MRKHLFVGFSLCILLILLLCLVVSPLIHPPKHAKLQKQNTQDQISNEQIYREDPLLRQGAYSGATDPSLEMRENVDFLLTPAILIQESITDGVILTYPEE